jgi:hypothetical protein
MPISCLRLLLVAALAWAAYTPPAAAYIDPTAAGAALQSMYVLAASALMTLALVPKKVAAGFARLKGWLRPGAPTPPDGDR